jgi:fibrillarin-like rRNA methylase
MDSCVSDFRKARRKDKEPSTPCSDDPKLYLEEAVLERKLPDIDLRVLVDLPAGLDYNEWLASHSKLAFSILNGMHFINDNQSMAYEV